MLLQQQRLAHPAPYKQQASKEGTGRWGTHPSRRRANEPVCLPIVLDVIVSPRRQSPRVQLGQRAAECSLLDEEEAAGRAGLRRGFGGCRAAQGTAAARRVGCSGRCAGIAPRPSTQRSARRGHGNGLALSLLLCEYVECRSTNTSRLDRQHSELNPPHSHSNHLLPYIPQTPQPRRRTISKAERGRPGAAAQLPATLDDLHAWHGTVGWGWHSGLGACAGLRSDPVPAKMERDANQRV